MHLRKMAENSNLKSASVQTKILASKVSKIGEDFHEYC